MRLVLLCCCADALPAAVTGWRGDTTGVYPEATPPLAWTAATAVWQVALPGQSAATPVLLGDRMIVMADPDWVLAIAVKDGAERWRTRLDAAAITLGEREPLTTKKPHKVVGWTCPTPVSDGERIVCLLHTGVLACLDREGKVNWATRVAPVAKGYGQSMSPAIAGGMVGVHLDDTFHGFDLVTGERRWQQSEVQHQGSPVGIEVGGVAVFLGTAGGVYRASDGVVATKLGFPALNMFSTPSVAGDTAWWISEGKFLVTARLVPGEAGTVTVQKRHVALDRGVYYASQVVADGLAYCIDHQKDERILKVVELAGKGRLVARQTLGLTGAAYPSPALAGGFLVVCCAKGGAEILLPRPTTDAAAPLALIAVGRGDIGEALYASPVFAGPSLFLRGVKHLFRFDATPADLARAAELRAGAAPVGP
jgi:outer membrane protein assembly factor BamB